MIWTRLTLECWKTLSHLRSLNHNMIINFRQPITDLQTFENFKKHFSFLVPNLHEQIHFGGSCLEIGVIIYLCNCLHSDCKKLQISITLQYQNITVNNDFKMQIFPSCYALTSWLQAIFGDVQWCVFFPAGQHDCHFCLIFICYCLSYRCWYVNNQWLCHCISTIHILE